MKRIFLLTFFLLTVAAYSQYTTPNTGVMWTMDSLKLYAPATVTGSFPDYTVTNNIIISATDRVTLGAGTRVTFTATTAGFEVNGTLKVLGTASDSVYLRSQTEDSLGAWVGLLFNDSATDSMCEVRYANIMFATNGFRAIGSSPRIYNSTLYKNRVGARFSSSDAVVSGCRIERSYEYGVIMTLSSSPVITNNFIKDNNTQNTSAKNQVSIGLQGNNSPVIKGNTISGGWSTRTGGISLWVNGTGAFSNAVIENNEIYNNSFGMTLYATSGGAINATVRYNRIYGNKINADVNTSGSGINVNGVPTNTPLIAGNIIYNNWWGITIQNGTTVQAGPGPRLGNLTNADSTDDGRNKIFANVQPGGTFDLYNNCTNDIYAQNNDWGVYDSTSIEANIYHKADNSLHGTVSFMPFYNPAGIPVELTSFSYSLTGSIVNFTWRTATETNNRGFSIERKVNGSMWETAAFIPGAGTSLIPSEYNAAAELHQGSVTEFRLVQHDFSGESKILRMVEINESATVEGFALHGNFPNPFNPETVISFTVPAAASVKLAVYNSAGEEVAVPVNEVLDSGSHQISFRPENYGLSSGIYYYRLSSGSFEQVRGMVFLK